ncbi:hypothetical protein NQZ68_005322, partial [Dissostichus eleginoides]
YRVSCGAGLENEEEFVDILEERRRSSDLGHALRTFSPHPYKGAESCSNADLNKAVLESQYLRYMAKEIAAETGSSVEEVREEACGILEEMSQNLQLKCIRLMGFTLTKVLKRLYSSIFVNMEGLNMLQQSIQEHPVILMPNHRSYMDFLMISYIMFTYDIPLPFIAAGIPLAGMKLVGELLRRSGAFFIRRAIGSDKLYWAVLSEYVRSIVKTGIAPLEFYVEGLRSRTLKSMMPKLATTECWRSRCSHNELLGIPKPKESTTGLLKASKVLQEDYGSMHVNFGRPMSVRHLCEGKINRCQYNLVPRDLPQKPSAEVQACVSWLAHLMVRVQEEGSVMGPWALMACLLLQAPTRVLTEEGLPWQELTDKTLWLRKLALDFGARLNWPSEQGQAPDTDVMSSTVALHGSVVNRKAGRVFLVQEEEPARNRPISPEEEMISTAAAVLMLASYRNMSLHIFVRPALLATALHITKTTQKDELLAFFCFLRDVFSNEFIFIPGNSSQDFEEACFLLKKCGAVHVSEQEVTVSDAGLEVLSFLQALLQPFIDSYQVIFRFLCENEVHVYAEKQFLTAVRNLATELILSGELHTYEALSSDTHKNVLSALQRLDTLTKSRA